MEARARLGPGESYSSSSHGAPEVTKLDYVAKALFLLLASKAPASLTASGFDDPQVNGQVSAIGETFKSLKAVKLPAEQRPRGEGHPLHPAARLPRGIARRRKLPG